MLLRHNICLLLPVLFSQVTFAQQSEVAGIVRDASGGVIQSAYLELRNVATNTHLKVASDESGRYSFPPVVPGRYRLTVGAGGFETHQVEELKLEIGAKLTVDVELKVGNTSQTVTVDGSGIQVNTVNANVSTVVDRQFVENIPLNGRSFQSLLTMSPGVLVVPAPSNKGGEISVNGQRTEANYFTVDGVSANTGAGAGVPGYGAGYSGSAPGNSILGTTQSLVSIDALQEFRATTSTYSAEYGRMPGGQFTFLTRSGTNQYHGSLFDYFRNDALDANNWFNNQAGLPKSRARQNNFGGTFGGPLSVPKLYKGQDRTFFFLSYEGLRLRSPQAAITTEVPSLSLRQSVTDPALRAVLNAYPLPNGADHDGLAYFTSGYSSPSSLDTISLRLDHSFSDRFTIFGRYSDSPSNVVTRPPANLAQVTRQESSIRTFTLGATNILSSRASNDLRFNATTNEASSIHSIDNLGGATPLTPDDLGKVAAGQGGNSWLYFSLYGGLRPAIRFFPSQNDQRQINVTDSLSVTLGSHSLKFGVDYRRLITETPLAYNYETAAYSTQADIIANKPSSLTLYRATVPMAPVYTNFSAFAQDEWRVTPRLSLSLGLRWDVNPAPSDANGNQPYGITTTDLRTMKLADRSQPLWKTTWNNFGPRLGLAYQLGRADGRETVVRAGAGIFYDTGNTEGSRGYWYATGISQRALFPGNPFPLTQTQLDGVPEPSTVPPYMTLVFGFDPDLKLPYVWQWNVSVEQSLGSNQTLTAGYLGSAGRRLTAQRQYYPDRIGNTNFGPTFGVYLTENAGRSDYHALQVKFQRRLSHGLQGLVSYTWSHGIDNSTTNFQLYQLLRASSDFDIRHNLQIAATYDIPSPLRNPFLSGWAVDTRISARTALPVDILGGTRVDAATGGNIQFHPNWVAGQPPYIVDANAPGGRRINFDAFVAAPANQEGNTGRNVARAFATAQTDITLRKDFRITEGSNLQFRAEAFNVFNRANFGSIYNLLTNGRTLFGLASNTQNGQLGGLNTLYQIGGPRSIQLALKLRF